MIRPLLHRADGSSAKHPFISPEWNFTHSGGVGWWVRADWQRALLAEDGPRIDQWPRLGRLSIVTTAPRRIVYRVNLPDGTIYVKHSTVPGLRALCRGWLRRRNGDNERRRARYMGAIGLPTVDPIALGERQTSLFLIEDYLITPEVPGAVPLNEFVERHLPRWPEPRRAWMRRRLAEALGEMTARLHEAGLVHQDFRPGNIQVRTGRDDLPILAMIDLETLRASPRLGRADAQRDLAVLNRYFWLRSTRADRRRFLRSYLRARTTAPPDPKAFARGIEKATADWAQRLWSHWDKRCQGTNKYFRKDTSEHAWSIASRDLDPAEIQALLADPDEPFRRGCTVLVKSSRTATVAEITLRLHGEPVRMIYKRFNRKKWLDPFLTYFRPTRGWRAWQAGQHMASRGVPTPRNLAFLVRTRPFLQDPLFWYLPHETYLLTQKEEPSITVSDYVASVLPALDPASRRRQVRRIILGLARLLRTMHERSLSNRDLKTPNILIVGDPETEPLRLSVIDLLGVHQIHPLPLHRRVQNLARLYISLASLSGTTRTDALAFLRAYLPWGLSRLNDWKGLCRAIEVCRHQKLEHNRRRGRNVS
jgi:tRNA A-37 threonylcarbamoyl transferase component Bud32